MAQINQVANGSLSNLATPLPSDAQSSLENNEMLAALFANLLVLAPQQEQQLPPQVDESSVLNQQEQQLPPQVNENSVLKQQNQDITADNDNLNQEPLMIKQSLPVIVKQQNVSVQPEDSKVSLVEDNKMIKVVKNKSVLDNESINLEKIAKVVNPVSDELNNIENDQSNKKIVTPTSKTAHLNDDQLTTRLTIEDTKGNLSTKEVTKTSEFLKSNLTDTTKQLNKNNIKTDNQNDDFYKTTLATQNFVNQAMPQIVQKNDFLIKTTKVDNQITLSTSQLTNITQVIIKEVKPLDNGTTKTLVFNLEPKNLGPINIVLQMTDNKVNVEFKMQHQQTHQMLQEALPKLQEILKNTMQSTTQLNMQPTMDLTNNLVDGNKNVEQTINTGMDNLNQQNFNHQKHNGSRQNFSNNKRKVYENAPVLIEQLETKKDDTSTINVLV